MHLMHEDAVATTCPQYTLFTIQGFFSLSTAHMRLSIDDALIEQYLPLFLVLCRSVICLPSESCKWFSRERLLRYISITPMPLHDNCLQLLI